jgi:hypothetical protein
MINLSLSKIRELHGGFKSICDNFAINLTEFETIFSSNESTFAIWDTDNNGKQGKNAHIFRFDRRSRAFCRLNNLRGFQGRRQNQM